MIACRILLEAPYADYQGSGTNRKVRIHSVGDIVLFPSDYAKWLEEHDLVEIAAEAVDVIEINESDPKEIVSDSSVPRASNSAIEYAADNGVDLKLLVDRATGSDGSIILRDVRKYVAETLDT